MNYMDVAAPIIQYGFAGFCIVLIFIIVWLINRLLTVLEKTNEVISRNTETIARVLTSSADMMKILRSTHDRLLSRPCLKERDGDA